MMLDHFHLLLALYWLIYVTLHSVLATLWFKKNMQHLMGKYFIAYRFIYTCLAFILLVLLLLYQYSRPSVLLFNISMPVRILCIAAAVAGLLIMFFSIRKYFFQLSGLQLLTKKTKPATPQVNGPNAYVRHPLYAGTLLMLWSLFVLFPFLNNLLACGIITLYTLAGIKLEERKLRIEYGDSYVKYQQQVPMLIPTFKKSRNMAS